jgi:hypothetical protein
MKINQLLKEDIHSLFLHATSLYPLSGNISSILGVQAMQTLAGDPRVIGKENESGFGTGKHWVQIKPKIGDAGDEADSEGADEMLTEEEPVEVAEAELDRPADSELITTLQIPADTNGSVSSEETIIAEEPTAEAVAVAPEQDETDQALQRTIDNVSGATNGGNPLDTQGGQILL